MGKILLILGILSALLCYACCVVSGRADDWAEEIEWMMWDEDEDG